MTKFLFILFIFPYCLNAQEYYIARDRKIVKYDLLNCVDTVICDYSKDFNGVFVDIAISPDGSFYALNTGLYQLFLNDCTFKYLGKFPNPGNALVCDTNGIVYAGQKFFMKYTPQTKVFYNIGNFPMKWTSAGDFTFRDGKMYMITTSEELVEIDIKKPINSKLKFKIKNYLYGTQVYGMFTIPISCDSNETYCVYSNGTFGKLNFSNETIDIICKSSYGSSGASSPNEFIPYNCNLSVDLDFDNSSGGYPYDFKDQIKCYNINRPICDTNDIIVSCKNKLDSISIQIKKPFDGNSEYLSALPIKNIDVIGNGTQKLVLINKVNADSYDFGSLIKSISYNDTANPVTSGIREIVVLAYSLGEVSKPAIAYLPLSNKIFAGKDTTINVCKDDPPIDLMKTINATPGGKWVIGNGIFIPGIDVEGQYDYILSSPICDPDTAIVKLKYDCPLNIDLDLNNSSGTLNNDYLGNELCYNINRPICDTSDLRITSTNKIDSITILLNNPLNGIDEFIIGIPSIKIDIFGLGTSKVKLVNKNNALSKDFIDLIKSLLYKNISSNPTSGIRNITFNIYSKGEIGKPATAFIPVFIGLYAGLDTTIAICKKEPKVDLLKFITGSLDGYWNTGDGIFTPGIDSTGQYLYITNSEFCGSDTAIVNLISDCTFKIDLDFDNSSGALKNDFNAKIDCSNINISICDTADLFLISYNKIDSIQISINNPLDGNAESLIANSTTDIDIIGSGTSKINMINNGSATIYDFSNMIKNVKYQNTAYKASPGTRNISVLAYCLNDTSEKANAFIPIIEKISAGKDTSISVCEKDPPIELLKFISGSLGGKWIPGSGIYYPGIDSSGKFLYIVKSIECGNDTAIINILNTKMPEYLEDSYILSCDSLPITLKVLNAINKNITWQDGIKNNEYNVTSSGLYYFIADNGNGCILIDSTKVILSKPHFRQFDFLVNPNELSLTFEGIKYTSDTSFCNKGNLSTYLGCDSSYCVNIKFIKIKADDTLNIAICKGESYNFNNHILTISGTYFDSIKVGNKEVIIMLILEVKDNPDIVINGPEFICNNQSIILEGYSSKNVKYLWQDGSTNKDLIALIPQSYYLTVTDGFGCSSSINKIIKEAPALNVKYEFKNLDCSSNNNGTIEIKEIITGTPPVSFSLISNGKIINDADHLLAGTYTLIVSDLNNCTNQYIINIQQEANPKVYLGPDLLVFREDSVWLTAKTDNNSTYVYEWSPIDILIKQIDNKAQFIIKDTTKIKVTIIDQNDCIATDDINIFVKEKLKVYFPNSFSPNYDGINDKFTAFADPSKWQVKELSIYDRWGEQVYTQKNFPPSDPAYGWNGNYRDKPACSGVYVYYAVVKSISGEEYMMKGDVNVVR